MNERQIIIIGAGLVALGTAWKLSRRFPSSKITILEKEAAVAQHQSSHNSGVLHCGLYYKPGSLKARMAVEGIREMTDFVREHGIPHEICGKIVVAIDDSEVGRLNDLHDRGIQNGLSGLHRIGPEEIREREPHSAGVAALLVPQEGIVDFPAVAEKLAELLRAAGHEIQFDAKVIGIVRDGPKQIIATSRGEWSADFVINCAGLHCDRIFALTGEDPGCRIVPFRGEYFTLAKEASHLVKHLIYPVPDPRFPFLGVHFTRMIGGGVEAGPSAVLALKREGYRKTDFSLRDTLETLTFPGLYRFLRQYPGHTWREIKHSASKRVFGDSLRRLVPELKDGDLSPGPAGVRAQAMTRTGELIMDFFIESRPGQLHVLNAPSPGATASLAIGGYIAERVALQFV